MCFAFQNQKISVENFKSFPGPLILMLTRREVLAQMKKIGAKEPALRKIYLRDFEKYMEKNYGLKIGKEDNSGKMQGKT